ncbi:Piso0_001411 [Millerozyma farinosa CBS 7064]|uniref:Piso0_001411 protein n=1 Tax=Pichia sorbitophila (strain ATCC MYA-4447 / BCRC 22081 / CBS 7064 / NBRC 10061 / NRRL Y-12695) TaxID=559304 RepID=G8YN36_PICSO|nr:Piso0_001411 [Millerozyma farinosa CBS 7064]
MNLGDINNSKMERKRKLPKLSEICTKQCIQSVNFLFDIGSTPFHLLKPILQKMNAKQLQQVESKSPQIMPESDILWSALVEKEFPDRPLTVRPRKLGGTKGFDSMPMKSLYYRYSDDRDSFRKDAEERLRRITHRLKIEKSAKSIVSVPQLLKDPTVRRRRERNNMENKNSIIRKAIKESQNRALMFPNVKKRHDPYDAFAYRDSGYQLSATPPVSRSSVIRRPEERKRTFLERSKEKTPNNNGVTDSSKSTAPLIDNDSSKPRDEVHSAQHTAGRSSSSPPRSSLGIRSRELSDSNIPRETRTQQIDEITQNSPSTIRKRKAEPSVFLPANRARRQLKPVAKDGRSDYQRYRSPQNSNSEAKRPNLVKSSIFN